MKTLCQGCGRKGHRAFGAKTTPRWCRCTKKPGVLRGGPFVAAPGHVAVFVFESKDEAAFRERCRLLSNAERAARDALSDRFVRCGSGWRELPRTSPKRARLERAYDVALAALEVVRAECAHASRSIFDDEMCDVCHAHVESDIEQHRHLVREGVYSEVA